MRKPGRCVQQVEDPRIAKLIDGRILMGRDLGITTIQVPTLFLFTAVVESSVARCTVVIVFLNVV